MTLNGGSRNGRGGQDCPLCTPPAQYPSPQDRHPDLRRHLATRHGVEELAEAIVETRAEFFETTIEETRRVTRIECSRENSPLSRAIIDAWPDGETLGTSEIANAVGEREARTLVALKRLLGERVVARVGLGKWRLR